MNEFFQENPKLAAFTLIMITLIISGGGYLGCRSCQEGMNRKEQRDEDARDACLQSGGSVKYSFWNGNRWSCVK